MGPHAAFFDYWLVQLFFIGFREILHSITTIRRLQLAAMRFFFVVVFVWPIVLIHLKFQPPMKSLLFL